MSKNIKISLRKAILLSDRIQEILAPHCVKFDIAGSVRRCRQMVGDIEIVCQPKTERFSSDLFSTDVRIVTDFNQGIIQISEQIIKGSSSGRYMQILLKGGVVLDLFMPQPDDYYRQLAIRTGTSFFTQNVIAAGWKALGWVGCENYGLRRIEDCEQRRMGNTDKWFLVKKDGEKPPVWESEEDFFSWLQVAWVAPQDREQTMEYKYLAK